MGDVGLNPAADHEVQVRRRQGPASCAPQLEQFAGGEQAAEVPRLRARPRSRARAACSGARAALTS